MLIPISSLISLISWMRTSRGTHDGTSTTRMHRVVAPILRNIDVRTTQCDRMVIDSDPTEFLWTVNLDLDHESLWDTSHHRSRIIVTNLRRSNKDKSGGRWWENCFTLRNIARQRPYCLNRRGKRIFEFLYPARTKLSHSFITLHHSSYHTYTNCSHWFHGSLVPWSQRVQRSDSIATHRLTILYLSTVMYETPSSIMTNGDNSR